MAKQIKKDSKDANTKKELDNSKSNNKQLLIVGIGASAGGLEALESFFKNMPENTGMAFVIVQHLDPNHIGIMPELLQRITTMKVNQITDNMQVLANNLYIIPPKKSLSLLKGRLHLFNPVEPHGLRLPIDIFFKSLAGDQKEKSIGIILSGMGSDGSLGVKSIKENNGLVLVQEPASAKFDSMPNSAIHAVNADIIAPIDKLPDKLISFLEHSNNNVNNTNLTSDYTNNIAKVIILLREKTGHDFSQYKKSTLYRRIDRRKGVHQIKNIRSYVRYIQENPEEIDILFQELLIGVTSFFRDKSVWEKLTTSYLPKLIKNKTRGDVLRVWVPACSTGEEVYSLAIIFNELIEKLKQKEKINLQIFATDIDSNAITIARKAWYSKNIMADVSANRLKKYFKEENNGYRISTSIRELVIFATHDIIKDSPFTKLDMISCRNMLIYMESELQTKIISLFHYSLNPEGIMLLGKAESLGQHNLGFKIEDSKHKIFRRSIENPLLTSVDFLSQQLSDSVSNRGKIEHDKNMKGPQNIKLIIDQIIIQHYAPSAIIVNDKGDIIYISGRTGKYIEPASGKANWNIFAMAREGLRNELPNAFRKANKSYDKINIRNLKIGINGGTQIVDIVVQKLESPELVSGLILIVITDTKELDLSNDKVVKKKITSKGKLGEIELELQQLNDDLKKTKEEMQSSQEELKSANEELQSTNEELQSTNEELTTSKEEMQSLNEELQTVNSELQSKVNDHLRESDDMKNLLNSIEVATLFIDKKLNIRRFTNQLTNIFKIRKSDIGRQFTDLVSKLKYPEIDKHARIVLETLVFKEISIETTENTWYHIRIMPYRTVDDRIDGLVITFTNITKAKQLEFQLIEVNKKLSTTK